MTRISHLGCLMLVSLALGLTACAPQPAPPSQPPGHARGEALYQEAVAALAAGRYPQAKAWFQSLDAPDSPPSLARRARYGLAATALAAARTPQEAVQALDLWRAWSRQAPPAADQEDPRLLGPLVEGLGVCLANSGQAPPGDKRQRDDNARLQEENARLRRQLADLEALHQEMLQRKNRLGR